MVPSCTVTPKGQILPGADAIPSCVSSSWEQNPGHLQMGWDHSHPPILKGLVLLLRRGKHPHMRWELVGVFKKRGETGLGEQ